MLGQRYLITHCARIWGVHKLAIGCPFDGCRNVFDAAGFEELNRFVPDPE